MARKRSTKEITAEDALTVDVRAELQRAKAGDKAAAREVLECIHTCLRISQPLGDGSRQYLLDALRAGIEGRSVDAALGRRRGGRSSVSLFAKRLVAYSVQGFMRQGLSLDDAAVCAGCNDHDSLGVCNQLIDDATKTPSAWEVFKGRHITSHQARKWYIEIIGAD